MTRKKGNGGASEPAPEPEATGLAAVPEAPPAVADWEALKAERDELEQQLLRRRADFENYKKRVERDRHQVSQDATADVLKALVPTLDNLDRAREHSGQADVLRAGLELIHRDLLAALVGLGLQVQDPLGELYDPKVHEALSMEDVPGAHENKIVEVFRKGYTFKDRLLRAALVKVAKGESEDGGEGGKAVD
jgi:molecular chaperone GrpE